MTNKTIEMYWSKIDQQYTSLNKHIKLLNPKKMTWSSKSTKS